MYSSFRKRFKLENSALIYIVLILDAMSLEPVQENLDSAHKDDINAYLFQIVILRSKYNSLPLHLFPYSKGSADIIIKERLNQFKEKL